MWNFLGKRQLRRPDRLFWGSKQSITGLFLLIIAPLGKAQEELPLLIRPTQKVADLSDSRITESSGIARSYRFKDCYWTHNDSGDEAQIFLVNRKGNTLHTCLLRKGKAIDWEDIASFEADGKSYLVVGDIGGNAQKRNKIVFYLLEEPALDGEALKNGATTIDFLASMEVKIPGGVTNYEGLGVDALDRSILLVEKSLTGGNVYSLPISMKKGTIQLEAQKIGRVYLPMATACDVSPDSSTLAIASYGSLYIYRRGKNDDGTFESWQARLTRAPESIQPPKLRQTEAVCFDLDGQRLIFTSEQRPTPMYELLLGD